MAGLLAADRQIPRCSISSITYLSPTEVRTSSMPLSRSASSRPMLLITVATSALPVETSLRLHLRERTSAARHRRRRRGRSASTKIARSPSPSNATPSRQPFSRTVADSSSGCVDPQSRLMLRPSGDAPMQRHDRSPARETAAAPPSWSRRWPYRWRSSAGRADADREAPAARARYRRRRRRRGDGGRDRRRRRRSRTRSATIASTSRSSASVNFSPRPEKTLMPLSSNGLCDAEITMPASKSISRAT